MFYSFCKTATIAEVAEVRKKYTICSLDTVGATNNISLRERMNDILRIKRMWYSRGLTKQVKKECLSSSGTIKTRSEVKCLSLSHFQLFVTPWTVVHQAPLYMEFSKQEYWSGLLFPTPGDLPNPEIEPRSPALQAVSLPSEPPSKWRLNRRSESMLYSAR